MLLALGDSIFRGYLVGGHSLIYHIEKQGYEIMNLSNNGFSSFDLLEQIKNLDDLDKFQDILIHIGINDFLQSESIETVKRNIFQIYNILKDKRIIFVIPYLISEKCVDDMWANSVVFRSTISKIMEYKDFFVDFCGKYNLKYISFYDYLLDKDYQYNLIDGIHPDEALHKILSEFVIEKLVEYEIF